MSYPTSRQRYFEDVPLAEHIQLMEDPHRDPYMANEVTSLELKGYYINALASTPFMTILSSWIMGFLMDQWLLKAGKDLQGNFCEDKVNECALAVAGGFVDSNLLSLIIWLVTLVLQVGFTLWLGCLADFGFYRRFMMILLGGLVGLLSILSMTIVDPIKLIWLGLAFIVLARTLYSVIAVYRNGYIHTLTWNHPRTKRASHILPTSPHIYHSVMDRVANDISTFDLLFGHVGTLFVIGFILLTFYFEPSLLGLKLSACIVGGWYLLFLIGVVRWLPDRVFRPAPREWTTSQFIIRRLWSAFKCAWTLRRVNLYLLAIFLANLAFSSYKILSIALIQVHHTFSYYQIFILIACIALGGIFGLAIMRSLSKRFRFITKNTLIVFHAIYLLLPFILFLVQLLADQLKLQINVNDATNLTQRSPFSLKHIERGWMLYPIFFIEGFMASNLDSLFRVYFLEFLPPTREHEFFAHYTNISTLAVATSNFSLLFTVILFQDFKWAILCPVPLIIISALIIYFLNAEKAKWANVEFVKMTS